MKRVFFMMVAACLITACSNNKPASVQELVLDDQWKFATGDTILWAEADFDDSGWKTISSAKCWEDQGFPEYDGFGWYRKQVVISDSLKDIITKYGGIMIRYTNADDADEFYFNGNRIGVTGSMPPEYLSKYGQKREYIVPAEFVYYDKPNVMAVRVYDGIGGGGLMTVNTTVRPLCECDAVKFTYDFPAKEWVFAKGETQEMNMKLVNTLGEKTKFNVVLITTTDDFKFVDSTVTKCLIKPLDSISLALPLKLEKPGFYRCKLYIEKEGTIGSPETFNIGYAPEQIISPLDAKTDLESFWKETLAQLEKVAPNYKMNLLKERSTGARNIYHVEMMSFGNVKIEGFYAVPKAPGKYPAIAYYMGYGSEPWYPETDGDPGFACFVLSVRGQGIQKATSTYGDWIVWGLDSKENYYYRGAFMDLVRAIDFLSSRPEVDSQKIVAEGGSQGGAFTIAACALDHRIKAAAPSIPFLSDYRDYFRIVSWPRSSFETYLAANPNRTWEEVYDILTYFDIKNLAPWIECPVFMAAGLQDEVCPNHTNFAAYNQIKSEKQYVIYHDQGHGTPSEWYDLHMDFYRERLGIK